MQREEGVDDPPLKIRKKGKSSQKLVAGDFGFSVRQFTHPFWKVKIAAPGRELNREKNGLHNL